MPKRSCASVCVCVRLQLYHLTFLLIQNDKNDQRALEHLGPCRPQRAALVTVGSRSPFPQGQRRRNSSDVVCGALWARMPFVAVVAFVVRISGLTARVLSLLRPKTMATSLRCVHHGKSLAVGPQRALHHRRAPKACVIIIIVVVKVMCCVCVSL